jgi:hypothetical protein
MADNLVNRWHVTGSAPFFYPPLDILELLNSFSRAQLKR